MQYDTQTRQFTVYAEPFSLIGIHDITVQAMLATYLDVKSAIETTQIDLIDPCIDPKGIVPATQTNPAPYYYEEKPVVF